MSEVRQGSLIEVSETGTEAAAVSLGFISKGGSRIAPFQMIVHRPLFFVIDDNLTQTILFMGIVNDPTR